MRNGLREAGWVGILAVTLAPAAAQAGVARHDLSQWQYQNNANTVGFRDRGGILNANNGVVGWQGSSVYIGNQWLLTAAHVVMGATAMDFESAAGSITGVDAYAYHSLFNPAQPGWGYDIALVKLSSAPTGVSATPRYTGNTEMGDQAIGGGFGLGGTGLTGQTGTAGTWRAGYNRIDNFLSGGRILQTDFDSPDSDESTWGSSTPEYLEIQLAQGDSGGGLWINEGVGWRLAGIASFLTDANGNSVLGDYGDHSSYTRVSVFESWIQDTIAAYPWVSAASGVADGAFAGGGDGQHLATWVVVPEPATVTLLGAACVLALSRRNAGRSRA